MRLSSRKFKVMDSIFFRTSRFDDTFLEGPLFFSAHVDFFRKVINNMIRMEIISVKAKIFRSLLVQIFR